MERVYYQRYLTRLRVDGPERVGCVGLPFVSTPNASAKRRRRKKRRGLWEGLREGHVTQPSSTGLPLLLLLLHHHQNSTGLTHLSLGSPSYRKHWAPPPPPPPPLSPPICGKRLGVKRVQRARRRGKVGAGRRGHLRDGGGTCLDLGAG